MRYSAASLDDEVRRSHLSRCDRIHNYSLVIGGEGETWGHAYEQLLEKLADHENMRDIASFKEWTMARREDA